MVQTFVTMQQTFRRLASAAASAATKRLVDDLRENAINAPSIVRKQVLDPSRVQCLNSTLNRRQLYRDAGIPKGHDPANGTPLPPGYHLVYFTPAALLEELGSDGTDISYSPGEPFTRRMWAGGELKWRKENPLRIGDEAIETTKLVSAESKNTRMDEEMIVVSVEKIFENRDGFALIDKRDWVFRTRLSRLAPMQDYPMSVKLDGGLLPLPRTSQQARDFLQTTVSLFRFSALTFNAHKIHYSRPWCREVEGHREIVVHGPLNLINMLDFWRDAQVNDCMIPQSIRYRATAPFYAGEVYRALIERDGGTTSIKMWGHDGKGDVRVGMIGDIVD